jgi:hypothetical protein
VARLDSAPITASPSAWVAAPARPTTSPSTARLTDTRAAGREEDDDEEEELKSDPEVSACCVCGEGGQV